MLRCQPDLVPAKYVSSPASVGIGISDSGWDRPSEVSALVSLVVCSLTPLRICTMDHAQRSHRGGVRRDSFNARVKEVTRTFGLISVVTSGMVESYNGPVGAVVWGEDMMHHATLMAHGGGVGWRSVQTPPPQMLTSPSTWSPSENGRDSTSDVDVVVDLAWARMSWVDPLFTLSDRKLCP
ncbi:hypothetical protein BHE74_00048419 [Ensete ventricosum]|nr:hypothetical protein BHE74_00048419 [Ensete ventricosum]